MKRVLSLIACAAMLYACACGGEKKPAPTEETKSLPASSLVLKGKHAKMFKLGEDDYKVSLVQTNDGWQVRVKMTLALAMPYNKLKDYKNYEQEITCIYGRLLNSSEVEIESLNMDDVDELECLPQDDIDDVAKISGHTWDYLRYSYETAKEIFDKTVAVEISGLELNKKDKGSSASSLFDSETNDAINDVKGLIEAEGELLEALTGIL